MKIFRNCMLVVMLGVSCLWAVEARADAIPGLYNTGVAFSSNSVDQHYALIDYPYVYTGSAYVLGVPNPFSSNTNPLLSERSPGSPPPAASTL